MNDFKFCPECGGRNVSSPKGRKWLCADCGFELYNNVASAVGLIIRNKEGRILLEKRRDGAFWLFREALLTRTKLPRKRPSASVLRKSA